jgi:hypothetical protein
MQATLLVKEDEKALKKTKTAPEPKATISKKRNLDQIPSTEPKVDEVAEKTPSVTVCCRSGRNFEGND